ncbi:hypothetical protein ES703_118630 [subsurface metagenome]
MEALHLTPHISPVALIEIKQPEQLFILTLVYIGINKALG